MWALTGVTVLQGSGTVNPSAAHQSIANKRAKLALPWEETFLYAEQPPERNDEEVVDDNGEEEQKEILARLASADQLTENMTKEEYAYWSECRQASFTFKKTKRFRQWIAFDKLFTPETTTTKVSDDIVDVLGFLISEIIKILTEEALAVKAAQDLALIKESNINTDTNAADQDQDRDKEKDRGAASLRKRKRETTCSSLFHRPRGEERTPVSSKHVREAFRRLQVIPNKYTFMRHGYAGLRTPLRLI